PVAGAHEAPLPDALTGVAGIVQIGQPEPVAGLVHHCPHRHDLARVATVQTAHAAVEDVVRDLDRHTLTVHGVRCVGHDDVQCVLQVGAARPEVVVRGAAAGAVDGGV